MYFIKWVITLLGKSVKKTTDKIVLAGYNRVTICQYFRKQGARIGERCHIGVKSLGAEPYLVSMGNHVWISVDVTFHTHDGGTWVFKEKYPDLLVRGPIIIGDNCFIGRGVQLLPNTRIGSNSIIGAGSVVISDIPPNCLASGVPARPLSSLAKYEERCLARWKEQKPPEVDISEKGWYHSKKNQAMMRKHLMKLFINPDAPEKGGSDQPTRKTSGNNNDPGQDS